jgi:AraC-like DNA-binding protein
MTLEVLECIVKNNLTMRDADAKIFQGDKPVFTVVKKEKDFDWVLMAAPRLLSLPHNCGYYIQNSMTAYGIVFDKESDLSVIFGPYKLQNEIRDKELRDVMIREKIDLNAAQAIKIFLNALPGVSIAYFLSIIVSLNSEINHEVVKLTIPEDYGSSVSPSSPDDFYNGKAITEQEFTDTNIDTRTFQSDQRMMDCVKQGNYKALFSFYGVGTQRDVSILNLDYIRAYKDCSFGLLSLVSQAAMQGGADPTVIYSLHDIYLQKIEKAQNEPEINSIQGDFIKDCCEKVTLVSSSATDNPTINRALAYINEHLRERLNAEIIGEHIKVSPAYLSARFKKKAGQSLPDYISTMKIREAERLLIYTDKPLSDIAAYLSFSSQSYFQNIFKKLDGVTPKFYRERNKK